MSEQDYPIQPIWILGNAFKRIPEALIASIMFVIYLVTSQTPLQNRSPENDYANIFLIIVVGYVAFLKLPAVFFWDLLRRRFFKFSVENDYVKTHEGVITKSVRMQPYKVIQHVIIEQSLVDRFLKTGSLVIENASEAGGYFNIRFSSRTMGSSGNKLVIPGLKLDHAEQLKALILNKIDQNKSPDLGM